MSVTVIFQYYDNSLGAMHVNGFIDSSRVIRWALLDVKYIPPSVS